MHFFRESLKVVVAVKNGSTYFLLLYYGLNNDKISFCSEANLGAAARIIVTIAASDEAHGVFQFSADSLTVNGTEPEEGRSTVVLQVSPSYKHGSSSMCFFCPMNFFSKSS